ncbi:hypothetical protein CPBF426_15810 [Xanthomonas arboricola pv. juglandis]|nr:hypothetical protein [Xanthomonas euroxanthea]SYZ52493.1 hypothetical protein CPBF426_15810 [Xanthomonas arboricola pv. juglandis]
MRKTWPHFGGVAVIVLAATPSVAQTQQHNPDYDYTPGSNYGPIQWPLRRQHLLAGHYVGRLQVAVDRLDCPTAIADLRLEAIKGDQDSHRYTLKYTCLSGRDPDYRKRTVTLRSTWWIDEIAGSCLVLEREPDPKRTISSYPLYGFRIDANGDPKLKVASLLSQDGSDCESGGASEYVDKQLKRIR